jgi:hypothetical protein
MESVDVTIVAIKCSSFYDPVAGTWNGSSWMTVGRVYHTETFLPINGKVLVVGGLISPNGNVSSSAEVYDP